MDDAGDGDGFTRDVLLRGCRTETEDRRRMQVAKVTKQQVARVRVSERGYGKGRAQVQLRHQLQHQHQHQPRTRPVVMVD